MNTIAPQLPTLLGSLAAMLVAFLSLMNGTSPETCVMKAISAFLVFAGFGLVLRFVLASPLEAEDSEASDPTRRRDTDPAKLDVIVPGTPVGDLFGSDAEEENTRNGSGGDQSAAA